MLQRLSNLRECAGGEDHWASDFRTFLLAAEKLDKRERERECGT